MRRTKGPPFFRRNREFGGQIVQYALVLALVVLLSVPALMFMGGRFDTLYRQADPISRGEKLFSILDPEVKIDEGPPIDVTGSMEGIVPSNSESGN